MGRPKKIKPENDESGENDGEAGIGATTAPSNVTAATKSEFFAKAKIAIEEYEEAHEIAKAAKGRYQAVLKAAKKAGVNQESIAFALALRFTDRAEILATQRDQLEMLSLTGIMPTIQTDLFASLSPPAPEGDLEAEKVKAQRAYDDGFYSGQQGQNLTRNPHFQGTEAGAEWARGWHAGQNKLAIESIGKTGETKAERDARVNREKRAAAAAAKNGNGPGGDVPVASDPTDQPLVEEFLPDDTQSEPTKLFG